MAKHRTHSVDFKRQVSQEYLGGETLHALSKRHDLSRNLIRIWVEKYQAGALDEDVAGTYRELVEVAENCQVCIIHPGKPSDPNEPGLEELLKRAEPFA